MEGLGGDPQQVWMDWDNRPESGCLLLAVGCVGFSITMPTFLFLILKDPKSCHS